VQAVADTPVVNIPNDPAVVGVEDLTVVPFAIDVTRSPDTDDSETLSVRIIVQTDAFGPVGSVTFASGAAPSWITITAESGGSSYLIEATGANAVERENRLDEFLDGVGMTAVFKPRTNFAGVTTLAVQAISTEAASGNELAASQFGGADLTSKTETVVAAKMINVSASLDATLMTNFVGVRHSLIQV
jgi:hypothetical protein